MKRGTSDPSPAPHREMRPSPSRADRIDQSTPDSDPVKGAMNEEYLLTVEEFAKLVSMTPDHIRKLVRARKIRHVRVAERSIRIPSGVIQEMTVDVGDD